MRRAIGTTLLCAGLFAAGVADAHGPRRNVEVAVTNLSHALYFTPLLVASHSGDTDLFEIGHGATPALQAMAEGGDTSGLVTAVEAAGGLAMGTTPGGLLGPGAHATAEYEMRLFHNRHLSVVGMILPSNDGFIGLDSFEVPKRRGRYVVDVYGYDAGTEANDERVVGMPGGAPNTPGIPADPGGNAGSGGTGVAGLDHINVVHIHRGIVGDDDPDGGASDLDEAVHRWLNPIARVVIRVH